jgi:hypothetical protein
MSAHATTPVQYLSVCLPAWVRTCAFAVKRTAPVRARNHARPVLVCVRACLGTYVCVGTGQVMENASSSGVCTVGVRMGLGGAQGAHIGTGVVVGGAGVIQLPLQQGRQQRANLRPLL